MNEQEFNCALARIWRILKESSEINTKELFGKLSSAHMGIDRESLAFILGWLAKDRKISVELRGDNLVVSEQSSKYEFAFG
ncbi:winged helix-turn-helix domain-containing protein [Bacteroides sp.]